MLTARLKAVDRVAIQPHDLPSAATCLYRLMETTDSKGWQAYLEEWLAR